VLCFACGKYLSYKLQETKTDYRTMDRIVMRLSATTRKRFQPVSRIPAFKMFRECRRTRAVDERRRNMLYHVVRISCTNNVIDGCILFPHPYLPTMPHPCKVRRRIPSADPESLDENGPLQRIWNMFSNWLGQVSKYVV